MVQGRLFSVLHVRCGILAGNIEQCTKNISYLSHKERVVLFLRIFPYTFNEALFERNYMLNYLWAGMILVGIVVAAFQGNLGAVCEGVIASSKEAVE